MHFNTTLAYLEHRGEAIREAIVGTKQSLGRLAIEDTRAIEAHLSQIASYERHLLAIEERLTVMKAALDSGRVHFCTIPEEDRQCEEL